MITLKYKCGQTEMSFRHLSEKDFPNGWTTECCEEALKKAPKIEISAPAEADDSSPVDDEKASDAPKKRGRKARED